MKAAPWYGREDVRIENIPASQNRRQGDLHVANKVPEPAAMLLLATGLGGLAGFRRKCEK